MSRSQNTAPELDAGDGTAPGPSSPPGTALDTSVEPLIERLIHSPRYAAVSSVEIRAMIKDAVRSRCIARATSGNSEGALLWAAVTGDVGERFETCAEPEAMALQEGTWRGGEALWLLEVFAESELAAGRLVQAFITAAGKRPVRRGRGVPSPQGEVAVAKASSRPESPSWFAPWEDATFQLTTSRNVLRRLVRQDAELVTNWLTSDRMQTALGSSSEDRTIEQTGQLISSAHDRGQLLVSFAPLGRGRPEGFFMISTPQEQNQQNGLVCLSFATGDRYPLQQEDAVDAACTLISLLFEHSGVSCVSSRVFVGNQVVVNWFKRYWPEDALREAVPGLPASVLDFRITKEAWPATLASLKKQDGARPWHRIR